MAERSPSARRLALVLVAALVAACGSLTPAGSTAPTAKPTPLGTVSLTPPPGSLAPTAAIEFLVARMSEAVRLRDRDGYLAMIDLSEPHFALEHTRLADEWSGLHPVRDYTETVEGLDVEGDSTTGTLSATWTNSEGEVRTASWLGTFTNGPTGWRYAGEVWETTTVPHFLIKVAPGLEDRVAKITPDLPAVYAHVTDSLDYTPTADLQIKLYADPTALAANTLLSLPDIRGWNEPGEALKLRWDSEDPFLTGVIAHEMTHFTAFDRAGTKRTKMPWWLDEGLATFVARKFDTIKNTTDPAIETVAAWNANGELVDWDKMAVFETTPMALWRNVYPQGYAMVRFVSDRFGRDLRNQWLAKMATEMDIEAATPAVLGMSFHDLDNAFREWLTQIH